MEYLLILVKLSSALALIQLFSICEVFWRMIWRSENFQQELLYLMVLNDTLPSRSFAMGRTTLKFQHFLLSQLHNPLLFKCDKNKLKSKYLWIPTSINEMKLNDSIESQKSGVAKRPVTLLLYWGMGVSKISLVHQSYTLHSLLALQTSPTATVVFPDGLRK